MPDAQHTQPPVYVPSGGDRRRRAVFSSRVHQLGRQIAQSPDEAAARGRIRLSHTTREREALQILDDLSGRSLDSLYQDASMKAGARQKEPLGVRIASQAVAFALCAVIGVTAVAAVTALQKDSRRAVREKLASQMSAAAERRSDLDSQVRGLETKIQEQTHRLNAYQHQSPQDLSDELLTASTPVTGAGLALTVSSQSQSVSQGGRVTSTFERSSVTDIDLQEIKDLLWKSGAEAIALNNHRLGPQTSIRHAGSAVLVGTEAVDPPYVFTVIGDARTMTDMMKSGIGKELMDSLDKRGITASFQSRSSLSLPAAASTAISHAHAVKNGSSAATGKTGKKE